MKNFTIIRITETGESRFAERLGVVSASGSKSATKKTLGYYNLTKFQLLKLEIATEKDLKTLPTVEKNSRAPRTYAVFRIGSNAANQSMCQRAAVGVYQVNTAETARKRALAEHTVYNNQRLEVIAVSKLSAEDRREVEEI